DRLVGFHLDHCLVDLDPAPDRNDPADDLGFGQAFPDVGKAELVGHQDSSVWRAAVTMRSTDGRYWLSDRFNGKTLSQPVTRFTGDSSEYRQRSAISAATSAPKPAVRGASWTITIRPVLSTDPVSVSASSGTRLRRSTTSTETPSSSRTSAALRTSVSIAPQLTNVTSSPSRSSRAFPIGTSYQPSGTSSLTER